MDVEELISRLEARRDLNRSILDFGNGPYPDFHYGKGVAFGEALDVIYSMMEDEDVSSDQELPGIP